MQKLYITYYMIIISSLFINISYICYPKVYCHVRNTEESSVKDKITIQNEMYRRTNIF